MLVSISEYARLHGKNKSILKRKLAMSKFKTAKKIGAFWYLDSEEPYPEVYLICVSCGMEFEKTRAWQKYCEACRPVNNAEYLREYHKRQSALKPDKVCVVCGTSFRSIGKGPRKTCSPDCAEGLRKMRKEEAKSNKRIQRNQY